MGRPLNKKYFGNRNIGTTTTADNGIGGEGVASITTATVGSININDTYPSFPELTGTAPTLPGGVTATYAVTWEVDTVTLAGGTGYTAGAITSITGLDAFGSPDCRFTVTVDGSGVPTFGAFTNRGEFTSIDGDGISTWAVVKDGDGAAQATIKFRVKSIAVTEKGSGYTAVPSLTWGTLNGTTPSGQTPSLTTDSGNVWSATNQENAIQITAYVPAINGGSSAVVGDIVKQASGRRYKVKTAQGTGIVKLVAAAPGAGEATIIATDANGNTYYVTKLTAHRALLTRQTDDGGDLDWVYATGATAPWSFAAAAGSTVQIANA